MLSRLQCVGARCIASPHQTPTYNRNSYRRSTRRYIMPFSAQLRSQVSLLLVADLAGTTLITSPARQPPTASATNTSPSRNTEHMALLKKDRDRTPRNCASGCPHFRACLSITGGRVQRSNFSLHADCRSYSRRGCRASIPIRRS